MSSADRLLLTGLVLVLSACSIYNPKGEADPFKSVQVGSTIVLNSDITVPVASENMMMAPPIAER